MISGSVRLGLMAIGACLILGSYAEATQLIGKPALHNKYKRDVSLYSAKKGKKPGAKKHIKRLLKNYTKNFHKDVLEDALEEAQRQLAELQSSSDVKSRKVRIYPPKRSNGKVVKRFNP